MTSATEKRMSELEMALNFWIGSKHKGDCVYTDKSDEGCHLCQDAEREYYPKHKALLEPSKAGPQILITLSKDGDKWCALIGENLQEGFSGFGDTPREATNNLISEWLH